MPYHATSYKQPRGGHTHTPYRRPHRNNFKKPGAHYSNLHGSGMSLTKVVITNNHLYYSIWYVVVDKQVIDDIHC